MGSQSLLFNHKNTLVHTSGR